MRHYLPIDPESPQERIDYLLDFAQVGISLTQSWITANVCGKAGHVQRMDVDLFAAADDGDSPEQLQPLLADLQRPDDLAYVIFTSGSTGMPKGVMIDTRRSEYAIGSE